MHWKSVQCCILPENVNVIHGRWRKIEEQFHIKGDLKGMEAKIILVYASGSEKMS